MMMANIIAIKQSKHCVQRLQNDHTVLELQDFGAGSRVHASYKRKISENREEFFKAKKICTVAF